MIVKKKFPAKVACVHCNGGCRAKQSPEGYDLCTYGCTGCGTCIATCHFGAISLNSYGVAEVDESKCIGCGACYLACPQRVIHLRLEDNPIVVLCSNKDARCKDVCEVSCIGCGLCEKTCPAGAIKVSENRAFIFSDKCLSCGACAMVCPRGVYVTVSRHRDLVAELVIGVVNIFPVHFKCEAPSASILHCNCAN